LTKATKEQIEDALTKLARKLWPPIRGTSVHFVYDHRPDEDEYIWDVYKVGKRIRVTYYGSINDPFVKDQLKRACEVALDMLHGRTTAVRIKGRRAYDL